MPAEVKAAGERFFNLNFGAGAYGTINRSFTLTMQSDLAINGEASVDVPTTVMQIFGYGNVPVKVRCGARLNFTNTDVMMVLDTTGSMNETNAGDSAPKIDILRSVVKSFYAKLEASKTASTRIRYGFLPYSTNVNVGGLLKSDWMVDEWTYQSRKSAPFGSPQLVWSEDYVSGTVDYLRASYVTSCPADTLKYTEISGGYNSDGTGSGREQIDGMYYSCSNDSEGRLVAYPMRYTAYVRDWQVTETKNAWLYQPQKIDVTWTKGTGSAPLNVGASSSIDADGTPDATTPLWTDFEGCIEERDTYEIDDYAHVDFTKALDLDLDLVPDPSKPGTQWRPLLGGYIFDRGMWWDGSGTWEQNPVKNAETYLMPRWAGLSVCPNPARNLEALSPTDIDTYLYSLVAEGSTYHDIGMIWGGRMLSPSGIFAGENADIGGVPTSRNMIFLTDGETAPYDLSYGTYGVEPLDQRRWNIDNPKGGLTLTQVVEGRFSVACEEVKKKNITVWVISFGISLNPMLTKCAGPGHAFEARDAATLSDTFSKIAEQLGDLRISK